MGNETFLAKTFRILMILNKSLMKIFFSKIRNKSFGLLYFVLLKIINFITATEMDMNI